MPSEVPTLKTSSRLLAVALLLVGCAAEPAAPQIDSVVSAQPPGRHYQMTLLPSGDTIRYTLWVPAGLGPQARVPLVLAMHFGGQVAPWMGGDFADLLVRPAFVNFTAVFVAPDAGSTSGWSSADEARVMWLAERLREVYPVDPARVVVTGFSAGGAQTWLLANRHQDFFTAAIPVSARPRQNEEPWRIPVRVVHSRADEVIDFETVEAYVSAQRVLGAPMELQVVEGVSHYQTSAFVPHLREAVDWLAEWWR